MDPAEVKAKTEEIASPASDRFNRLVAVSVSVVAVFLTVIKVKDGNVVQHMLTAQAQEMNHWSRYQAKSVKQHVFEGRLEQWKLELETGRTTGAARAKVEDRLKTWEGEIARYEADKTEFKARAEEAHRLYEELDLHDDQFDLAEALLALAIALWAVSSLARSRPLYFFGLATSILGLLLGLAGFLGWSLHPAVIKILT